MNYTLRIQWAATLCAAFIVTTVSSYGQQTTGTANLTEGEALKIAEDAYIFGYPLITFEMTRRVVTNTAAPRNLRAPMNQFSHSSEFPPITYRDIPFANVDTLYSFAWLNLAEQPYILSVPDSDGIYFMLPMLDGWTDVFQAPGTRTTGTKAQNYVITGPNWKGELPNGLVEYKSATNLVTIGGRTYWDGTAQDHEKVLSFQNKVTLVPLSAYGHDYSPPAGKVDPAIDTKTSTKDQIIAMDGATYFKLLAALMKDNPPTSADAPMVAEMAKIGLVPGKDWDVGTFGPLVAKAVAGAPKAALKRIVAHIPDQGRIVNGWRITSPTGTYGTDYLQRALLNYIGPGWNLAKDAVYPTSIVDSKGQPLNGGSRYLIHFAKGQLPPVKGFWSLTMYTLEGWFVPNPLDRVSLSQRDKFNVNQDGSIDLYVQHESPGKDKESNWLPSPKDSFELFMRLYWPDEKAPSILDGSWKPPPVERASQ